MRINIKILSLFLYLAATVNAVNISYTERNNTLIVSNGLTFDDGTILLYLCPERDHSFFSSCNTNGTSWNFRLIEPNGRVFERIVSFEVPHESCDLNIIDDFIFCQYSQNCDLLSNVTESTPCNVYGIFINRSGEIKKYFN